MSERGFQQFPPTVRAFVIARANQRLVRKRDPHMCKPGICDKHSLCISAQADVRSEVAALARRKDSSRFVSYQDAHVWNFGFIVKKDVGVLRMYIVHNEDC
ncbi:hypothetical protein Bbelb_004690 [Branchiostoma belcheri]|nr:hypothetical protein Bbelb_004690 [Branchiostoma belcheri]